MPHSFHDTQLISDWARGRGLTFMARGDDAFFRRWEPFDNIAPPTLYRASCTWVREPGYIVLVEPWYALEDSEPLDRTVFAFCSHPALLRRAAMRVGEHFVTRTLYLESTPPPEVKLGDAVWDQHVTTFARSVEDAEVAFHPKLRALLQLRGFRGHLELRGQGMVVFCAGLPPTPGGYEELLSRARELVSAATTR